MIANDELVFLKLGGSLITDKTKPETVRLDILNRLAWEIVAALSERPHLQLLIGHGSGSFGHVAGARYRVRQGVHGRDGWHGYVATAAAAARLNRIVTDVLWAAGIDVMPLPPSASALCHDGKLVQMAWEPTRRLLSAGVVPVLFGDVALDDRRGGTIVSTEEVFSFLVPILSPGRIILAGEVAGVFSSDPHRDPAATLIPVITQEIAPHIEKMLSGTRGTDVTGGMAAKVQEMLHLVITSPHLKVQIISGLVPGRVQEALIGAPVPGTLIRAK